MIIRRHNPQIPKTATVLMLSILLAVLLAGCAATDYGKKAPNALPDEMDGSNGSYGETPIPLPKASPPPKPAQTHSLELRLDPDLHTLQARDSLWLAKPVAALDFLLNDELNPVAVSPGDRLARLPEEDLPEHGLLGWRLERGTPSQTWLLEYSGTLFQETAGAVFGREKVGGEIEATIGEEGVYLSGGAGWYPLHGEGLLGFRVTTVLPEGWKSVTQGRLAFETSEAGWTHSTWDAPLPSDGMILVANRFHVDRRMHGSTAVETWFFPEDSSLAGGYLDACERYLDLYESFLGPYPYSKFAVVENFFPTGYGMPSWTLLGQRVLQLPFIKDISLGHELAHNWWGNSVFIGEGGNWCEGITVYCSDYLYKDLESSEASTQYRKNLLKDYTRYTRDGGDFPLTDFVSRHNHATRAVGYGKSMMVFHTLEELLGRDVFRAALRRVIAERQWSPATWSDFFRACEVEGGMAPMALEAERVLWIEHAGAARIALDGLNVTRDGEDWIVSGSLLQEQDDTLLILRVPLRVTCEAGDVDFLQSADKHETRFSLRCSSRPLRLSVDPDFNVFRRLHEDEMEATIGLILAAEEPVFVLEDGMAAELSDAFRGFAASWVEGEPVFRSAAGLDEFDGTVIWFGTRPPEFRPRPEALEMNKLFTSFQGKSFDPGGYCLVYTGKRGGGRGFMAVLADSPGEVSSVARRAPHYSKYSYLGFASGRNQLKGNWDAAAGPLNRGLTE